MSCSFFHEKQECSGGLFVIRGLHTSNVVFIMHHYNHLLANKHLGGLVQIWVLKRNFKQCLSYFVAINLLVEETGVHKEDFITLTYQVHPPLLTIKVTT